MDLWYELFQRTTSTLIASLATVTIIAERQRRINNAKIEVAARHIESIEEQPLGPEPVKEILKDLKIAGEMVRQITWGSVSRASKIEEVLEINRSLNHAIKKHERIELDPNAEERSKAVAKELADSKFTGLADRVRRLKISFIDFIFVGAGTSENRARP